MLQVRPHMNDPKLPVHYTFPNEMVPDVDMLRIRCGSGIIRQVQRPYVILVNRGAPYVTTRKDKIPDVTQENRLFPFLGHRNILRSRRGKSHTLLCPREKRNATTSTHHNTARNRFPVSSPAGVVRIHIHLEPNTTCRTPLKSDTVATRESDIHQDMQRYLPVRELRCVRIPSHGSRRVEDIRRSLVGKTHQMSN